MYKQDRKERKIIGQKDRVVEPNTHKKIHVESQYKMRSLTVNG
jgi:hypothetical protein